MTTCCSVLPSTSPEVRTEMFGLYANVRPCVAYHPYVDTKHPGMDVVIVRENEEDLYAGIEHRQEHVGRVGHRLDAAQDREDLRDQPGPSREERRTRT